MRTDKVFFLLSIIFVILIPSGADAGWTENGAPVCTAGGVQDQVQICEDGTGGTIIVWRDRRSIANIYAQRLDEMGRRLWAESGVLVCGAAGAQAMPQIVSDGSGGAFIVWEDFRGGSESDIYAQRIDASGAALWTADGVSVCSSLYDQTGVRICRALPNGCFIAWEDERGNLEKNIYVQKLDSDGANLWTANGLTVCNSTGIQAQVDLLSDGYGGVFLVWADNRGASRIYAQRVISGGTASWAENGIQVFTGTYSQYAPHVVSDGGRGIYVSMYDSNYRGYIQRVDDLGSFVFPAAGVLLGNNSPYYSDPKMLADGIGGAILVWQSWRDSERYDAYAQRVDRTGTLLWGLDGVGVCTFGGSVYELDLTSDGIRGAIISWRDTRNILTTSNDIFVQRIDSLGAAQWAVNGESLCGAGGSQSGPVVTTDGMGGAIVAWQDNRDSDYDAYAMKITRSGGYVATALAGFLAGLTDGGIRIDWTMSCLDEEVSFRILRSGSGMENYAVGSRFFEEIAVVASEYSCLEYDFIDSKVEPGVKYIYRVELLRGSGGSGDDAMTLFETLPVGLPPVSLKLAQNVPNPFNPATTISFYLPARTHVSLDIFDVSGKQVATLIDETRGAGIGTVTWNGISSSGDRVASGIYLYRLSAGKTALTRKMLLLR